MGGRLLDGPGIYSFDDLGPHMTQRQILDNL